MYASWTTRETPDPRTNHDVYFAYSNDDGATWKTTNGSTIAKPVVASSSDVLVYRIPQDSQIINQEAQCADRRGRFHALMRDNTTGIATFYHYMRSNKGKLRLRTIRPAPQSRLEWRPHPEPSSGDLSQTTQSRGATSEEMMGTIIAIGSPELGLTQAYPGEWTKNPIESPKLSPPPYLSLRGKIAASKTGQEVFALIPDEPTMSVQIHVATEAGKFEDWTYLTSIPNNQGEPLVDYERLERYDVLSVFIRQGGPFPERKVQVWDFALDLKGKWWT